MAITIIDRLNWSTRTQRAEKAAERFGEEMHKSAVKYRPDLVKPIKEMKEEARETLKDRGFFNRD